VGKIELILADAYNSHLSYNFKIPANPKVDQLVDLLIKQVVQRSSNSKLLRKKNICLKKCFSGKLVFLPPLLSAAGVSFNMTFDSSFIVAIDLSFKPRNVTLRSIHRMTSPKIDSTTTTRSRKENLASLSSELQVRHKL
jgi:hypothetical protein